MLIGRKAILTAGHCLYSPSSGWKNIDKIYFQVYNFADIDTNNVFQYKWKRLYVPQGWASGNDDYDFAVIQLAKDQGGKHAGDRYSFMPIGFNNDLTTRNALNIVGHPVQKPASRTDPCMYGSSGHPVAIHRALIFHDCDTGTSFDIFPFFYFSCQEII